MFALGFVIGLLGGVAMGVIAFFVVKNNLKRVLATKVDMEIRLFKLQQAYDLLKVATSAKNNK